MAEDSSDGRVSQTLKHAALADNPDSSATGA
jgi:hypothetical protein